METVGNRPSRLQSILRVLVIWAILDIIFLPWTALKYVMVFPGGIVGLTRFDVVYTSIGWVARSSHPRRTRNISRTDLLDDIYTS